MAKDLIECKVCHEEKSKAEHFTKKAKQVTCNECLEKAKRRRASSALDRITALEKENEELRRKLEAEFKEKDNYIEKFRDFSGRYEKLCLELGSLTLHKK
jgi:hypothetical protein